LIRNREVFDPPFSAKRCQVVVEIFAEGPIGEPEKFKMKCLESFSKGLELAQKGELLQLHIAQLTIGLRQLQNVQEEGSVNGNLAG
jgi:hypothetical protein